MHVRVFQGSSTQEVLAQVKAEMGSEAVILGSRDFRKGNERFFEITAGIERQEKAETNQAEANSQNFPSGFEEWHKDWTKMKEHLYALMQPALHWEEINPRQRLALEYLQNEGVENDVVVEIFNLLQKSDINGSMLSALTDIVPVQSWEKGNWQQHIHLVVGPFGVGKSITAFRLALLIRDENPKFKIAFINTDSTRGNGRLILRHFTELSGFSYYEAMDKNSFVSAIKSTINFDYVFIDLKGLSKNETLTDKLEELGLVNVTQNIACHLCLSPHYSSKQLDFYIKQYKTSIPSSIIWTKLDESVQFGSLVNVAAKSHIPVSALSYGAELNQSLCSAKGALLWRMLLKGQLPEKEKTNL